jgi:hypothetical protein
MSIDSAALTLPQYAQMSNDPLIMKVVLSLRSVNSVLVDIPFVTKKSFKLNGARFSGTLPTVGWAKLNETPATVSAVPEQFQESAFLIRNIIAIDHLMEEEENQIVNPRAFQLSAYLKSVAHDVNNMFINNNHNSGDKDAIVGIRARIDNPTIYGSRTDCKIDAGAAVITTAATAAQANAFFDWLDQLLYALDAADGDNVVLYMNATMKRRVSFLARVLGASGGYDTTKDQFDRTIETYKNARLVDVGVKGDQSTGIILNTEASTGADGSSDHTSIYGVRYGDEYLTGWQFAPLKAQDLGLDPADGVQVRTLIEWMGGIATHNTRSMARLFGLKIK